MLEPAKLFKCFALQLMNSELASVSKTSPEEGLELWHSRVSKKKHLELMVLT